MILKRIYFILLCLVYSQFSFGALNLSPVPQSGIIEAQSSSTTVLISNTGSSNEVLSLSLSSTSKVTITSNRCSTLKPNTSCYVILSYPNYGTSSSDHSTILKNGVNDLATIHYAAKIVETTFSVSASPSSLSFGTLSTWAKSGVKQINITNTGNGASTPIITPSSNMGVTINRCVSPLLPNQSCYILVSFNPESPTINGALAGLISIKATISSTPVEVSTSALLNVAPKLGGQCPVDNFWNGSSCSPNSELNSCLAIKQATPSSTSGIYSIDPDAGGPQPSFPVYCDMSGVGVVSYSRTCNEAKLSGEKNSLNNTNSGVYTLDPDMAGPVSSAQHYCDMETTAYSSGGYTLVSVINFGDTLSSVSGIPSLNDFGKYLSDSVYTALLANSTEIVFRTNRGDSTELVSKINKAEYALTNSTCPSPNSLSTIAPYHNYPDTGFITSGMTMPSNTNPGDLHQVLWFWSEASGCNNGGADYSGVILNHLFSDEYLSLFNLHPTYHYVKFWDWSLNNYTTSMNNGPYGAYPKTVPEHIYIFVK